MTDDSPSAERADDATSTAQVGFVVLAALALVVAAFLVPVVAPSGGAGSGDDSGQGDSPARNPSDGGSGEAPDGTFDWYELLEWFLPETDGEPTRTEQRCSIALDRQPEPGGEVTARISYEGEPLADAPVWFNAERVGTTNADGEVTGTVPYERELTIRVDVPGRPDCRASTGNVRQSAVFDRFSPSGLPAGSVAVATQATPTPNASVTYPVDGTVTVDLRGRAYPGETLTVESTISGRSFRGADVFVNGESVAETDTDGTATIEVPDDGSERLRVRVVRGDFAGSERVDILLLSASLRTQHLLALPGTEADVLARLAEEPTEATVFVGGERRGTTEPDGRRSVELPLNPTTTIAVETTDQRATTSVADRYAGPVAVFALVVALLALAGYRLGGRRGVAAVGAGVCALTAVVVADGVYGPTGRYIALGIVVVACILAVGYRWRRSLTRGTVAAGGTLRGLLIALARRVGDARSIPDAIRRFSAWVVEWAYRNALRAADGIGTFVAAVAATVRRTVAGLSSVPGSASELLERLRVALRSAGRGLRTPRTRTVVGVAVAATGAAAVGYRVADVPGAVVAVAVTLAVGFVLRRRASGGSDADASTSDDTAPSAPSPAPGDADSIRTLWRGFARLVAPARWRSSTPEEIATAAVEQGLPRRPVRELTRLFREVEYGGRSLSSAVRSRANDAYDAIRRRDRGEER